MTIIDAKASVMDLEADPFTRPSIVPEADKWREAMDTAKAEAEAERKRQRDQQAEMDEMVKHWTLTMQELEAQRDDAVRRADEAQLQATREVHDHHWATVQATTELEDTIANLENLLEEERAEHKEELKRQAAVLDQARQECLYQLEEAEQRHSHAMAGALARAREAEENTEQIRLRAHQEIAEARAREDRRVAEVRAQADERMRALEAKMRDEANMRDSHLIERQKLMEEALLNNSKQKQDAVQSAQRHLAAMEQELQDSRTKQEALFAQKEARMQEVKVSEKQHMEDQVKYHKELLELEKSMHARTMERTMDRVTRHLKVDTAEESAAVLSN